MQTGSLCVYGAIVIIIVVNIILRVLSLFHWQGSCKISHLHLTQTWTLASLPSVFILVTPHYSNNCNSPRHTVGTHINIIRHARASLPLRWVAFGDSASECPPPALISHCHKSIRERGVVRRLHFLPQSFRLIPPCLLNANIVGKAILLPNNLQINNYRIKVGFLWVRTWKNFVSRSKCSNMALNVITIAISKVTVANHIIKCSLQITNIPSFSMGLYFIMVTTTVV